MASRIYPRQLLALTLALSLVLVASSSLWHHDHPGVDSPIHRSDLDQDGGHALATSSVTRAHPADACSICLTQQLLRQSRVQAETGLAVPLASTCLASPSTILPGSPRALSLEARGPPLC
jgi:hypothetical protein